MDVLAIDVGSSAVRAGIIRNGRLKGPVTRAEFATRYSGERAEVDAEDIGKALGRAIRDLGDAARLADLIAMATMSPSWVALDARGRALTPIVTHQDRRSQQIAEQIERRVGKLRHLQLCGSPPVPGGISSTTFAWFMKNRPELMKRADLIGHVQTFLLRRLCGVRLADPSHASFMGLYSTLDLSGWNEELCQAIGVPMRLLPEVRQADQVAGGLLPEAARRLGLLAGMPVLVGLIDTGAAVLLSGAKVGQLVNVVGSTDVLALCTNRFCPRRGLLTRALGTGRKWLSVGTIAAAGSSLLWVKDQFFADLSNSEFFRLVSRLAGSKLRPGVKFEPYLAGDRASVRQRWGALTGLRLSTTREEILQAVIEGLAEASTSRIELLRSTGTPMRRQVMICGGGDGRLARLMWRNWPRGWQSWYEPEASLRGLAMLAG